MKDFKMTKKTFVILLCTLMVFFAVSASATSTWNWTDEVNTVGTKPVEHKHVYGEWVITEENKPTCNSTGERQRTCLFSDGITDCGKVYTEALPKDPDTHVRGTETVVKAATCGVVGESTYKCTVCGETETVYTETVPHTFDENEWSVVAPIHDSTREMPGSKINRCTVCGVTVKETIPVEHTFDGEPSVITAATCTQKGSQLKYCTICKKSKKEEIDIDSANHVYSGKALPIGTVDCKNGGKGIVNCEDCGKTDYVNISADQAHDYLKWEYTEATGTCLSGINGSVMKSCDTCHKVFESKFWSAHVLGDNARTHAATCSDYGYTKGTCTLCLREDAEVVIPVDESAHSWIEEVLIVPTCTDKGYVFRMCKYDSSHVEYTDIPAAGHTYITDWNIVKVANCHEQGIRNNTCVDCNELISEFIPIDSDNHPIDESAWKIYNNKYPTCTEVGIEAAHCPECVREDDLVFREVPKHTDTLVEYSRTEATCCLPGKIVYDCYDCGEDVIEEIPVNPTAHRISDAYYMVKQATCSEKDEDKDGLADGLGILAKVCDYCMTPIMLKSGEHAYKTVEAKRHIVTEWEVTKDATCAVNGIKTRKCVNCGHIENADIAASHRYQAWVVEKEATCVTQGTRTRGCYNCDKTETQKYYGTHQTGEWTYMPGGSCEKGGTVRKYCIHCKSAVDEMSVDAGEHVNLMAIDDPDFKPTEEICQRKAYKCDACKDTLYVTSGHTFIKTVDGYDKTCTTDGMTPGYYCPFCKFEVKPKVTEELKSTGHYFEYDDEGTKYCLNCNLYYVDGGTSETCDHFCHNKGTVAKVMTKVFTFFWKIIDKFSAEPKYQYCECGVQHY